MMWNRKKNSEIQVFRIQGGAHFQTNLKWLAHKIWMLKSNFKLVVRKFVRCFIAVQNFKKFGRVLALQNVLRIHIFPNKNRFS